MTAQGMTYKLAFAAAQDAGTKAMRKGGRKIWSGGDYRKACEEFARLWPTSDVAIPATATGENEMIGQSETTKRRLSFEIGQRVQLHPATDRWLRGDRYGEVTRVGTKLIHVKMDVSGQVAKLHPSNILEP